MCSTLWRGQEPGGVIGDTMENPIFIVLLALCVAIFFVVMQAARSRLRRRDHRERENERLRSLGT